MELQLAGPSWPRQSGMELQLAGPSWPRQSGMELQLLAETERDGVTAVVSLLP